MTLHVVDKPVAKPHTDQQPDHSGYDSSERYIGEQPRTQHITKLVK